MSNAIDWAAAERLAAQLGLQTRDLVASRDPAPVSDWAYRMASQDCGARAATYYELAALVSSEAEMEAT
jgi:hypothetical protein